MSQCRTLICTVGGSDKPIVTALGAAPWDRVLFVCSDSSVRMLTDPIDIPGGEARPPIPQQASLAAGSWSHLQVPPDDPDDIYRKLIEAIDRLRAGTLPPDITVDFTGGTKSMSVGAVLAVAARPGLHLQVTSGERTDLVRVLDGTQRAITLGTNRIAMDRQIDLLRDTWSRYGYQEAADGFDALLRAAKQKPGSVDDAMLARLKFWAALGRSFAAWDRFDRRQAATGLRHPLRKAGPDLEKFGTWANALEANAAPLVLFDLMRNAERCAIRERHDDAVARCYRLWEWTAQWLLQAECDIRTDAVDPERLDAELSKGLTLTEERVYQIASDRAWRLYRQLRPRSEAALFWDADNEKAYRDHAYIRNYSILAHGYLPIDGAKSKAILAWTAGPFMEMVRSAARRLGQPDDMPQLPRDLPEPRQG